MAKKSAGILLYRIENGKPEVFLVHPGGPFFAKKDAGAWTIPKGEYTDEETALNAALREFEEETGHQLKGTPLPLRSITQKGGKIVECWVIAGDIDPAKLISNTFEIQWPPHSGKMKTFPEIDKGAWFSLAHAREKINERQVAFINELEMLLESNNII